MEPTLEEVREAGMQLSIVGDYLDKVFDMFYGRDRLDKTPEEAEAFFTAQVKSIVDEKATPEFLEGVEFTLGVIFNVLDSQVDEVNSRLMVMEGTSITRNIFGDTPEYDTNGIVIGGSDDSVAE